MEHLPDFVINFLIVIIALDTEWKGAAQMSYHLPKLSWWEHCRLVLM